MLTELCELAYKYGTDKCPQIGHNYTPVYYELLKDKKYVFKKILELGIGSSKTMQWTPEHYQVGASLRMWRDFFPNAHIYGVDIDESTLFEDDRITTMLVNTNRRNQMLDLIKKIGLDIDLVIDDAGHNSIIQLRAFRILMPLLGKKDVLYIIEDCKNPDRLKDQLIDYNCQVFEFSKEQKQDTLIIIKKYERKN